MLIGKDGVFIAVPYDTVATISQHNMIINRALPAFLTVCCFRSTSRPTTSAAWRAEDVICLIERLGVVGGVARG